MKGLKGRCYLWMAALCMLMMSGNIRLAQASCAHINAHFSGAVSYDYPYGVDYTDNRDGKTHSIICDVTRQYICDDCGVSWDVGPTKEELVSKHYYVDNVCRNCNAVNTCAHTNSYFAGAVSYSYPYGVEYTDNKDGKTHSIVCDVTRQYYCDDCETSRAVGPTKEELVSNHYYVDNVCKNCDAVNTCTHTNSYFAGATSYSYPYGDEYTDHKDGKTHSIVCDVTRQYICNDCGMSWDKGPSKETVTSNHYYVNNVCRNCGWEELPADAKWLTIVTQPKSAVVPVNQTAKFAVKAAGDGLSYQWYYRNAGETEWQTSSCTKDSYSIKGLRDMDGREFFCRITDQYGIEADTNVAMLTLLMVEITAQPKDAAAYLGEKVKISLEAKGDGLVYQWYYSTDGGNTWQKSSCVATSYSQTLSESVDGRMLKCVVTDAYGDSVESRAATLTLLKNELQITKQPTDIAAYAGEKVTFSVAATGDDVAYQWWFSTDGGANWKKSSCVATSYSQTLSESVDGRMFKCVVTDAYDDFVESRAVTLTLLKNELRITKQPMDIAAYAGEKVTFSVAATGDDVAYQWWFSTDGGANWKKSSCVSTSYSQTLSTSVDGRMLKCVVTDAHAESVESDPVTLMLLKKELQITKQPKDAAAYAGEKVTFSVAATGESVTYQWWFSTDGGANWKKSSCTATSYSQTLSTSVDGRMLKCVLTDAYGKSVESDPATLRLLKKELQITKQPSNVSAANGQKAKVSIAATGDGVTYQWYYSTDGGASWKKSSCTATSYSQTLSESVNGRMLKCVATDAYGKSVESNAAKLTLLRTELKITKQPSNASAANGQKAKVSIAAAGDGVTYQWYYSTDGRASWKKSSCTATSYSQTMSKSVDGRMLKCVVRDQYGSEVTSRAIKLTLK